MHVRVEPAEESLHFIRMVCRPSIGRDKTQFSDLDGSQIRYHSLRLETLYRVSYLKYRARTRSSDNFKSSPLASPTLGVGASDDKLWMPNWGRIDWHSDSRLIRDPIYDFKSCSTDFISYKFFWCVLMISADFENFRQIDQNQAIPQLF